MWFSSDNSTIGCSMWLARISCLWIMLRMVCIITRLICTILSWAVSNSGCFHLYSKEYQMRKQIKLWLVLCISDACLILSMTLPVLDLSNCRHYSNIVFIPMRLFLLLPCISTMQNKVDSAISYMKSNIDEACNLWYDSSLFSFTSIRKNLPPILEV